MGLSFNGVASALLLPQMISYPVLHIYFVNKSGEGGALGIILIQQIVLKVS
jgi:hypothetical protein